MGNNGKPAIRVRGLSKAFEGQRVLDSVDLEVARGETLTVLGRSGTGKSVLLKLIIGLLRPDRGEIEINGVEVTRFSLDQLNSVRKTIGFLFQQSALYDSLTVQENVAFPLRRHPVMTEMMTESEMQSRVLALLGSVGMAEAREKMPADISGGMKKRVGLARALALDPSIVLLDEPTTGLDPITAGEITDLIGKLRAERQVSSVIVTHDIRSVKGISDRLALLNEGSIVISGSLQDLKQSRDPFISKFMAQSGEVS
jgi:phospholipid/cholesterol/gamma-HCH transport system ATP-binding protein